MSAEAKPVEQLDREALAGMSAHEIDEAYQAGQLNSVLGRPLPETQKPWPEAVERPLPGLADSPRRRGLTD